jgi:hypothetical protein
MDPEQHWPSGLGTPGRSVHVKDEAVLVFIRDIMIWVAYSKLVGWPG